MGSETGRLMTMFCTGNESADEMAARAAGGLAAALGVELVEFPSHHGGFLGGQCGQQRDPDAFAAHLRDVLDNA